MLDVSSGFELVVLEGAEQGKRRRLRSLVVTLGRQDPSDASDPGRFTFPAPSLPLVQARLKWNDDKLRYVIEQRSPTHPTRVNDALLTEPVVLQAGDRIDLGAVVLEVRHSTALPVLRGGVFDGSCGLLVLSGVDEGKVLPLTQPRTLIRPPHAEATEGTIPIEGMDEWHLELVMGSGRLFVECWQRPGLVSSWPGLVYSRLCGSGERIEVPRGAVLVCGDVAMLVDDVEEIEELGAVVRDGLPTGDLVIDNISVGTPPYFEGHEPFVIRVLSGPDRGSVLFIDPALLEGPIRVGRQGAGSDLHLELPERDCAMLEIAYDRRGFRLRNRDRTSSVTVHWDDVRPGEAVDLVSGDRITMGRTMLSFECVPLQSTLEAYAIYHEGQELPLARAINYVGYRPENDLRINDRRLGPRSGIFGVRDGGRFYYRHLNKDAPAGVGDDALTEGQETPLRLGDHVTLAPGVVVRFDRRVTTHRPSDPVVLGP